MLKKICWGLVLVSILLSLPLIIDRYNSETSTKRVEVVADYDKIQKLSSRSTEALSEEEVLTRLKQMGVTTIALYELTIRDFVDTGIIQIYTTNHLNLFEDDGMLPPDQSIIVLSKHLTPEEMEHYQSIIVQSMPEIATPTEWRGNQAILVEKPIASIQQNIVGFDFVRAAEIKEMGFKLVGRVSTSREWQEEWLQVQFEKLHELDVHSIIFSGRDVLGFPDQDHMKQVAQWLNEYDMHFAIIEFHAQTGDKTLSQLTNGEVIRILSILEQEMQTNSVQQVIDKLSLGVLERNIRMVYLNIPFPTVNQPSMKAEEVLNNVNGVIYGLHQKISAHGFDYGPAIPFFNQDVQEKGWYNLGLIIGALALISLLAAQYKQYLIYAPLPLGLIAYAGARFLDKVQLYHQALALGASIAAPTLATILLYRWLQARERNIKASILWSVGLFFITSCFSLYGAVVTIGLLNNLDFVKYIEQFRGVKILYFAPTLLLAIYLFLSFVTKNLWTQSVQLLNKNIQVKHVVLTGLLLVFAGYYLSRSGNEAMVLPFELEFRQLLNDLFGVRPRTKEVFLGHPLFILATYIVLKYKKGAYLFLVGIIGQMSIVSTFTHLHTPLLISVERTVYGLLSGAVIGIILILLWKWIESLWRKRERFVTHAK